MSKPLNAPCAVLLRCYDDTKPEWRIGYLVMDDKLNYRFNLQQPCWCGYTNIARDSYAVQTWVRLDNYA